jgi:hypothetical protein
LILLKLIFIIIFLLTSLTQANAGNNRAQLSSILLEAEDYLSVKPSKSLAILSTDVDLSQLSESQFFRWHIAIIRAAVSLNRMSIMELSIQKLIQHKSSTEFEHRLVPILSSVGIWLRKSGFLAQAKLTLTCALTHNKIKGNKIKLLISIAIVSRHLKQNTYAVRLYKLAKDIAQEQNLTSSLATIENNLGVIKLEVDDVASAELHFRAALALYQSNSNRSGNIISGINLLHTFLVQNQQLYYQRLYPSIARLTEVFPNKSRQSTLFWLNTVYQQRQGKKINDDINKQLTSKFHLITDHKLQFSLKKHFADELNININLPNKMSEESLPPLWFNEISQCNWEKLATFNLKNLK